MSFFKSNFESKSKQIFSNLLSKMGSHGSKETELSSFSVEETAVLKDCFSQIAGKSDQLTQDKLVTSWKPLVDPQMLEFMINYLFMTGPNRVASIGFKKFSDLFYVTTRGTTEQKIEMILQSLGSSNISLVTAKDIESLISALIASFLISMRQQSKVELLSWEKYDYKTSSHVIQAFSQHITSDLRNENQQIDECNLEKIFNSNPNLLVIWKEIFLHIYGKYSTNFSIFLDHSFSHYILPACEDLPLHPNYSPIIEIPHLMFVNSLLPNEYRNKWRFLFSSKIHGESFSTMLGKILNKSPTLLIVEDEDKFIFGGFAVAPWTLSPKFLGDQNSMLFTLNPQMESFSATSYNEHYQYLNINQQTMPNGLGMGGQFDYWGLWIDCEYGIGHSSESCTTFRNYHQLSGKKHFKIRNIEVWAVGDIPAVDESDEELGTSKKSILDKNLEDKVMLELSGHTIHSDGFREPDMDL